MESFLAGYHSCKSYHMKGPPLYTNEMLQPTDQPSTQTFLGLRHPYEDCVTNQKNIMSAWEATK